MPKTTRHDHYSLDYRLVLLAWLMASLASSAAEPDLAEQERLHSLHYGVHLPDDRRQSRNLDLARELIEEQRYSESMPLLLDIFSNSQDSSYGVRAETRDEFESLRSRATKLIGELDDSGRQSYELACQAAAQRELEKASQAGDTNGLERVVRRYPLSPSAAAAAWRRARIAADEAQHELALAWLGVLRADKRHAAVFEPQMSIAAAASWLALGDEVAARRELEQAGVNAPTSDQLLTEIASRPRDDAGWYSLGGNRRRTREAPAGEPHLWARWQNRIVRSFEESEEMHAFMLARLRVGQPIIPVASPLAIGEEVLVRTPDQIIAINWQTGRRVWQTRPELSSELPVNNRTNSRQIFQQAANLNNVHATNGGVAWLDSVGRSLSSDGRRVFALRNNDQKATSSYQARQAPFGRVNGQDTQAVTNQLFAYYPQQQGKRAWSINGGAPSSDWAGAFFLGPPLAVDGRLFVAIEQEQAILLTQLDPSTGELLWKQPLATVESSIAISPVRRLTGAALASSGDVLICSTGAGLVVAIDLPRRALKWVCRLPVDSARRRTPTTRFGRRRALAPNDDARRRWLENQVVIVGNRVFVASPETNRLNAIDLATGNLEWSRTRGDGVLLATASRELAVVLSSRAVVAIDANHGEPKWRIPLPTGAVAAGRSLRVGNEMLVPLNNGDLLSVNLNNQHTRRLTTWEGVAGNLIYHRGAIVSQSLTSINRFDQQPGLLASAAQTLADAPNDPTALVAQGEAALSAGDAVLAEQLFRQAATASPDPTLANARLGVALLAGSRSRTLNAQEITQLLERTHTDGGRLEVLSAAAAAATQHRAVEDALAYALAAMPLAIEEEPLTPITSAYWLKPSRRLAGAVADAWQTLPSERHAVWREKLLPANRLADESLASLRLQSQLLAGTPLAATLHHEQVSRWRARGADAQAALVAAKLVSWPPPNHSRNFAPTAWSFRQAIAIQEQRRNAPKPPRGGARRAQLESYVRLPVINAGRDRFTLSNTGQRLSCWDSKGARRFQADIARVGAGLIRDLRLASAARQLGHSRPLAWRVGKQLILSGGGVVAGVDCQAAERGKQAIVWTARERIQQAGNHAREQKAIQLAPPVTSTTNRSSTNRNGSWVGANASSRWSVLGVSPLGVVVRSGDLTACLDPLTGVPHWVHDDLKLPRSKVFVGREYLYARLPNGGVRVRLLDGRVDRDWDAPAGDWLALRNGRLTTTDRHQNKFRLMVVEVDSGHVLFEQLCRDARLTLIENSNELLVVERTNGGENTRALKLTVIDIALGEASLRTVVDDIPTFTYLAGERRPFGLMLTVGDATRKSPRPVGFLPIDSNPLLSASLICLRDDGREAWRAKFENYEVIGRTPLDCPLILLGRRERRQTSASAQTTSRLLAIDSATGRSVFEVKRLREDGLASLRMRYHAGAEPSLLVSFPRTVVAARLSSAPLAPGPAYVGQVETPTQLSISDWWGVGQQFGEQMRDSIQPKAEAPDDED